MLRFILLAVAALSVTGCDSYIDEYQQRLVKSLPNQREVSFSDPRTYPGKVLCGDYEALSGNGFTRENKPYIVTPELVMNRPNSEQLAVYCSDDPQSALLDLFGLDDSAQDWARLTKHVADMQRIRGALNAYVTDKYSLPTSLEPLLRGDYGVSEADLLDGWGNRYRYEPGLSGRTAPVYELWSAGSDEQAGGRGEAADLHRKQIPLVEHVLALRK